MHVRTVETDGLAISTGPLMRDMVERYYQDMLPWAHYSLLDIYNIIKNLPYRPDPPEEETLMRPSYTMSMQGWGGDCDDKSIALASYAKLRGIPYRFLAVRRFGKDQLHHVYPELYIKGEWIPFDPTYNFNTPGRVREVYAESVII